MTWEPEKFLQNVELKLRGRTAILVAGEATFVVSLWLMMKSYSDHPVFSTVGGSVLLLAMLATLALGLLGKTRPDEVPEKQLTQVTQLGVVVARGIGSHKDMVQLLREFSGLKKLPPPTHTVRGSAANEADYVPLTVEESDALAEQIENGVEKLLEDSVKKAIASDKFVQLSKPDVDAESRSAESPPLIKGKKLSRD
jgi:hypothetical protein